MAMRVSGLISGMDTDSIVKQLTEKYSAQRDKVWKTKENLKIQQDVWKDLNKEVNNFFSKTLSDTRLVSSYNQNEVNLSNPKVASVTGSKFQGSQTLMVKQLATNTYLTGGKVEKSYPIGIDSEISVTMGNETKEVKITSDMSLKQVAHLLNNVGLSANFDEKNGRLFLASKTTGADSNFTIEGNDDILSVLGLGSTASKMEGKDGIISLNGTDFYSDTNNFDVNGYNITALAEGTTTLTIEDNSKIFDMVKNFVDEYNTLIKKIDGLYNAKKSGYEPLTDDQKYVMSDRQIEEWENKLKESALSKNEILGSLGNMLKADMSKTYKVDGKTYGLYSIGISTGNYFTTAAEDRNIYNIDENKLKEAISENPNAVVSFMSQLSAKMYDDLNNKMKSSKTNSIYTIYEDKQIKEDLKTYEDKITEMEKKIAEREDKYYQQFAKMEAALSKMQNQTNYLNSFFGLQSN